MNLLFPSFLPEVIFQHNLEKRPSEAALRRNQHLARNGLQLAGAAVIMRLRVGSQRSQWGLCWFSRNATLFTRSGPEGKQPRQMTRVPGCSWQGPTHFCLLPFRQKSQHG